MDSYNERVVNRILKIATSEFVDSWLVGLKITVGGAIVGKYLGGRMLKTSDGIIDLDPAKITDIGFINEVDEIVDEVDDE